MFTGVFLRKFLFHAAAFLGEFVENTEWAHIDIAGVMDNNNEEVPYLSSGMSGRPTRTFLKFLHSITHEKVVNASEKTPHPYDPFPMAYAPCDHVKPKEYDPFPLNDNPKYGFYHEK